MPRQPVGAFRSLGVYNRSMAKKRVAATALPIHRYHSPNIPVAAIRRYARRIAERFQPDKIILFGSYAYGTPHEDSDVDLLVVMPAADHTSQAIRISNTVEPPFPCDLIVRSPEKLRRRIAEGNWFLREIVEKGKVLYEKGNTEVGAQSRGRRERGTKAQRSKRAPV